MSLFNKITLTFTPSGGGSWSGGEYTSSGEPYTATGTLQPVSGRDLDNDASGQYTTDTRKFYTATSVSVNDVTSHGGTSYVVMQSTPYQSGILPHYRVMLNKIEGS
jgi:hypothetical protein